LAFVQFTDGFSRCSGYVYSVTPCLKNGLQGEAGSELTVHEQDPCQIERLTANTARIIGLLHSSPSITLTEIADSLATNFLIGCIWLAWVGEFPIVLVPKIYQ
jgi:hypothetical protein